MNRTFYIPKEKEDSMHRFVEVCKALDINYSKLLVEWIEAYNMQHTSVKIDKK